MTIINYCHTIFRSGSRGQAVRNVQIFLQQQEFYWDAIDSIIVSCGNKSFMKAFVAIYQEYL